MTKKQTIHIAILGTRGIPANYGGFETFAEELSVHLAQRGHDVTVYGRAQYIRTKEKFYRGVRLVVLPNIMHQYLDTPFNTSLATLHAIFKKYDILLYCNSANSFCTIFPRILGTPVVLNVDGLEWKRAKWNKFGKAVYKVSEFMSTFLPHQIVTDAREVQSYYKKKFNKASYCIPYGAPINTTRTTKVLNEFGVQKNK